MLDLRRFVWVYKSAGSGKAIPEGYKPPHAFDAHYDPETGGYRIGTVRTWKKGPHIKLRYGWYPYDAKSKRVLVGSKWKDLYSHDQRVRPSQHSIHPKPLTVKKASDELEMILTRIESPDDDSRREAYNELFIGKAKKIAASAASYLSDLQGIIDRGEAKGYLEEDVMWGKSDLNRANLEIQALTNKSNPVAVKDTCQSLQKVLDRLMEVSSTIQVSEFSPPESHYSRDIPIDVSHDPELVKMAKDKTVAARLCGVQGKLSTVVVGMTASGEHVIIKNNMASTYPTAANEAAAYELSKATGLASIPPTLLTKEPIWSRAIADTAEYRLSYTQDHPVHLSSPTLTSVQKYIDGDHAEDLPIESQDIVEQIAEIYALDAISGNPDRHLANILVDKRRKLWAIDSGEAFVSSEAHKVHAYMEHLLQVMSADSPKALLAAEAKTFRKLKSIDTKKIEEHLRSKTALSSDQIEQTVKRLKDIQESGIIFPRTVLDAAKSAASRRRE